MSTTTKAAVKPRRYGMVINLDHCTGCGSCMTSCAVENNVSPGPERANYRTGLTPMLVHAVSNGESGPQKRQVFIPIACMQCEKDTPCVSVCPQQAVELDKATGIVTQMPQRCLGCRYCMTACAYHARYFNWWDPEWPAGMERTLNPSVAVRMRGVVEKCNMCHGRLHEAEDKAAVAGKAAIDPADYRPACVEACATKAIVFGDLNDPQSEAAKASKSTDAFRFLARLGTEPKVYYRSKHEWVRALAERKNVTPREVQRG